MMTVLILGGSGHLGAALQSRARADTRVVSTYSSIPVSDAIPFTFEGEEPLPRADVAIGSFPLAKRLEGRSEAEVKWAVRRYVERCKCPRLVQLSTDAVFSGQQGLRSEADPTDPLTPYGISQARVDAALLEFAPKSLVVRTSFIFGWAGGRLDKRLAPLVSGQKTPSKQKWASNVYRAPTEVNFLAEAIWRAVHRDLGGTLHVAGPRTSIFDFFRRALEPLGNHELPPFCEETDDDVARDTSLSSATMERELGMKSGEVWKWHRLHSQGPLAA